MICVHRTIADPPHRAPREMSDSYPEARDSHYFTLNCGHQLTVQLHYNMGETPGAILDLSISPRLIEGRVVELPQQTRPLGFFDIVYFERILRNCTHDPSTPPSAEGAPGYL